MTPHRLSLACAALLTSAALPSVASPTGAGASGALDGGAQAVTLDRIDVRGQRLTSRPATGSRLALDLLETPASVFDIDRATLDARGVRDSQEALFGIPGLVVASPPGNGNAVTWRGFSGAQITQLFNGIDVQYASIAARPIDGWIVDRVEAIGGPSSFLYGAGAVGGSINVITRTASLDADATQGMVGTGSHGRQVIAGGINRRLGTDERHALRVDAGYSAGDGWAERNRREAWTSAASLRSELAPGLTHLLAVEVQKEDSRRPYWGTPALRDDSGRLQVLPGTRTRNYNVSDGFYQQDVNWARSVLEWQASSRGTLRNTLYRYDAQRDYRNVESYRFNADASAVIRSGVLQQRHDHDVIGNRLDWAWDGTLGPLSSQWNVGLDLSYNRQTRFPQSIGGDVDTVPLDASVPGGFFDIPGTSAVYAPDRTNRLRTRALSLENRTALTPRLSLLTALRHERIALDVENHRLVTPTNPLRYRTDYAPTTGRAGLNFRLADDTSVYAQFSTAADPPAGILTTANFATLRDFDLSRGRQIEMGGKTQFLDGKGTATLAAYRIVRDNLAISDPANPGQTLPVGQQSSRGLEATLAFAPTAAWSIEGNLGWVDATLDDFVESVGGVPISRAGNRPTNTPSRVANLWLAYVLSDDWSAGVDVRAVSSRYANAANTAATAGYGLLGAHLQWTPMAGTSVTLRGRNLADRTYVAHAIGTEMVYLGAPRSVELELRTGF